MSGPCDDRCWDDDEHEFYVNGGGFVWCWPRLNRYTPADRRTKAMLNRYPHNVIGAAVVVFGTCYGVQWKGSPRRAVVPAPLVGADAAKESREISADPLGWWVIGGSDLMAMLGRCANGEDPDLVYAEHYANSHEEPA